MQIYCRAPGHLGGLEVLEISISFFPCFQPIVSQPSNKYKAGMAHSQTFFSLFAHVLFLVLGSDCMCSSLCQLSETFTAEDGDPALACGCLWGSAHHLFDMSLYKWGNIELPGPASGDHWQLACHQDPAHISWGKLVILGVVYFSCCNFVWHSSVCDCNPCVFYANHPGNVYESSF